MHSIQWFWTTGIHDPAWVQAIAAVAVAMLTITTLAVLVIYAKDTHTLAKVSVAQITLAKQERFIDLARQYHAGFDCIIKARDDLRDLAQSLVNGTFGTKPQPPIYPKNWPDVTSAFGQRKTSMYVPLASLGVDMRTVDSAVKAFFDATDNNEKMLREGLVCKAVEEAVADGNKVFEALEEIRNQ
jgi:hypothetical protein